MQAMEIDDGQKPMNQLTSPSASSDRNAHQNGSDQTAKALALRWLVVLLWGCLPLFALVVKVNRSESKTDDAEEEKRESSGIPPEIRKRVEEEKQILTPLQK